MINVNEIVPGQNDRTTFDNNAMRELADSIREHDLIQPISVRPIDGTELYQIVAGERRYRACRYILGMAEVECIIIDATDEEAAALMLAENVARSDLDPIDEARAYQSRMDTYGWSIEDCAIRAGVSPIRIQFRVKLLRLTDEIQHLIRKGNLPIGYAQILSDAELDTNRQRIAVTHLRDNPKPTTGWFRSLINELKQQQAQESLFDTSDLVAVHTAPSVVGAVEPPHPLTTQPPKHGKTVKEVLLNQSGFWSQAASEWQALGKPFKKQECESAAAALQMALLSL